MTDIASVSHGSLGPIERNARVSGRLDSRTQPENRTESAGRRDTGDRVELSSHARYLDQLKSSPDVRQDRIDEIRSKIANGSYETTQKLDDAVGHLIQELSSS